MKLKIFLTKVLLLSFFISQAHADYYEKLPSLYLVKYGSDQAKIKVTYLFSIYCSSCLGFIQTEFPEIKKKYIDTGLVQWVWHPFPNPQKPLTYQAMICLGMLTQTQKQIFLENCADFLNERNMDTAPLYFQKLMQFFGHQIKDPYSRDFLLQSHPKESAATFISQKKEINVPSIEVNGEYVSRYPSRDLIEQVISKELNRVEVSDV